MLMKNGWNVGSNSQIQQRSTEYRNGKWLLPQPIDIEKDTPGQVQE